MKIFDSIVLYVEDIAATVKFYSELLGREVRLLAPTFASCELESGLCLEFKTKDQAEPKATMTGGGAELCISVPEAAALHELFETWKTKGLRFAQLPTTLAFGPTFVALDPDEHRIRVFVRA
ncbi:MAG TPA: VOC family protein [Rectinemataceae bacterium]|nr:VOC family protein [Rectinemataceae bacterium]